jgi:hypothetical protein
MARFNTFEYGDGTKYGTATTTDNYLWTLIIDWDGDGYFSGENEATRMSGLRVRRGRQQLVGSKGWEHFGIGEAVCVLENADGRYTPDYAASPLYPYVEPGKIMKLAVKDGSTGTNYGIMEGLVTDIQPLLIDGEPYTRMVLKDGLQWLKDENVLVGYQATTSYTDLVEYILDDVESPWELATTVPSGTSELASGSFANQWWTWQRPALDDLHDLADSQAANLFHGRDGKIYWLARDYGHSRALNVSQAVILRDFVQERNWSNCKNKIDTEYYLKSSLDLDTVGVTDYNLWIGVLGGVYFYINIADGETIDFDATFKYQDYRVAGLNERAVYIVYDTDLIDDITASTTISWLTPVGGGTRISITNNAGEDGIITGLEMNGDIRYAPSKSTKAADDETSISTYGPKSANFGGFWLDRSDVAQAISDWVLSELKDPKPGLIIQFQNRPEYQFYLDLYDRVLFVTGIDAFYRVGSIEHQWLNKNGQSVLTTMRLEPYITPYVGI